MALGVDPYPRGREFVNANSIVKLTVKLCVE